MLTLKCYQSSRKIFLTSVSIEPPIQVDEGGGDTCCLKMRRPGSEEPGFFVTHFECGINDSNSMHEISTDSKNIFGFLVDLISKSVLLSTHL